MSGIIYYTIDFSFNTKKNQIGKKIQIFLKLIRINMFKEHDTSLW